MKKVLLFASMISMSMFASSQLVITEVNYNPPGSGATANEYIEIYNNSQSAIDLSSYYLDGVIQNPISGSSLGAGEYFLLVRDSLGFQQDYGILAEQFEGGGLVNGGEDIVIKTIAGDVIIDSMYYDDAAPWDTLADGYGYSLELCNVNVDNKDVNNWRASVSPVQGLVSGGFQVYGTPGAANSVTCGFSPNSISELNIKEVVLYPNPVNLGENIILSENVTGVILDITGKQISSVHNSNRISSNDFSKGIYFLNTSSFTKRFVVR